MGFEKCFFVFSGFEAVEHVAAKKLSYDAISVTGNINGFGVYFLKPAGVMVIEPVYAAFYKQLPDIRWWFLLGHHFSIG